MKKNTWGLILQLVSIVVLVVAFLIGIFIARGFDILGLPLLGVSALMVIGPAIVFFTTFFSLGTIICLLADIEYNTRKSSENLSNLACETREISALKKEELGIPSADNTNTKEKSLTVYIIIAGIVFVICLFAVIYVLFIM